MNIAKKKNNFFSEKTQNKEKQQTKMEKKPKILYKSSNVYLSLRFAADID